MTEVLKKMRLKPGYRVLVQNVPDSHAALVTEMAKAGAEVAQRAAGTFDFVHVFATTRAELEKRGPKLRELLNEDGLLWVSYPKGKTIPTDINRDSTRETLEQFGLEAVAQVAVDDVWSALRFKRV